MARNFPFNFIVLSLIIWTVVGIKKSEQQVKLGSFFCELLEEGIGNIKIWKAYMAE